MSEVSISCPVCGEEILLEVEWEEGDSNYGADADGNRGISVPGGFLPMDEVPSVCPNEECKHEYTEDEKKVMEAKYEKAIEDKSHDWEPYYPEPDLGPEPFFNDDTGHWEYPY